MSPTSAASATSEAGPAEIPMLIDGNWRAASESYAVRDPYRNTIVSHAPRSSLTDLDDALNIDEVFRFVSDSRFGLQTGIFTKSTETAIRAVRNLRTGGVIINGSSTWRTDQLAYGGVKDSGIGREGPRYSIRDMTEERMVLFNY